MLNSVLIAYCTCPDEPTAARLAQVLVSERLAACVNRIAGVRSTYFWDGGLQDDPEILLIMKTTAERLPALTERVKALHPYELPEVLATAAAGGNEGYLQWVRTSVQPQGE